jgi:thiol-disulfide isomerase/thioredoxin
MTDPAPLNSSSPATLKADAPNHGPAWLGRAMLGMGLIAAGALVYVLFAAATNLGPQAGLSRFATGSLMPLERLPDPPEQPTASFFGPDGLETTLQAHRGKLVLVNLWATWCAPCVTEMPTLAKLQQAFPNAPFKVLAISVDKADAGEAAKAKLADLTGSTLTFYHDPKMGVVYPMKARGFPTTVLYGPDGKEIARLAGEADWNSEEARGLIAAALSGER